MASVSVVVPAVGSVAPVVVFAASAAVRSIEERCLSFPNRFTLVSASASERFVMAPRVLRRGHMFIEMITV
jgi:hypothetical protein